MSKLMKLIIALTIIVALAIPLGASIVKANAIPTFNIVSVVPDEQVTIQTYDFPEDMVFDVLMGEYGSMGMDGVTITTQDSGKGGTFTATYKIPAELKGKEVLSIRLENVDSGYYAYNWFDNRDYAEVIAQVGDTGTTTTEETTIELSHPFFAITEVAMDKSVTVKGNDFPKNEEFEVTFGSYSAYGLSGIKVATQKTGDKGEFIATYDIPKELAGEYMVSIYMENVDTGYYAFNYFYNADYASPTEAAAAPQPTTSSAPAPTTTVSESGYSGYPFFSIPGVVKDTSIKIKAENLPVGDKFDVILANFNGGDEVKAGTIDASKAVVEGTFMIPVELKGVSQISVRLSSPTSGYFAYNYFFNDTFPIVPTAVPTEAPAPTVAPTTVPTKVPVIVVTPTAMPPASPTATP